MDFQDHAAQATLDNYTRAFWNEITELASLDSTDNVYVEADASQVDPDSVVWYIHAVLNDQSSVYLVNNGGESLDIPFHRGGHSVWVATTFVGEFGDELLSSADGSVHGQATATQAVNALLGKMGV